MPTFATGTVERVLDARDGLQRLEVRVGDEIRTAVLYQRYAAGAAPGDRVVLNTTAVALGLGSGGDDFVVWNLEHETHEAPGGGHIMKLRYTPAQSDVLSVEAPESPHHAAMLDATDLGGMPVVATSLHSQLLPVVVGSRLIRERLRIAYVMTDGGALEVPLSDTIARLRGRDWICGTISVGHAIGGDLEAVNLYSGLLASREVLRADLAVVGMGPGVVGTATPFGNTGVELGLTVNAAAGLGGRPVACVRMSEGDPRHRHAGVSHHVMTALRRVAVAAADVAVPAGWAAAVAALADRHRIVEVDASAVLDVVRAEPGASHMGRGPAEDPLFFEAAGAAGMHAASLV